MIKQAPFRGLSSTFSQAEPLQKQLVDQFGKKDSREMMKGFVGSPFEEGTTIKQSADIESQKISEAPVLWAISSVMDQTEIALQRWEGMVIAITEDSFIARLKNKKDSVDEEIEMSIADISSDDKELFRIGAIFYWGIGRETLASGQVKRSSVIKFRRLPSWSERELVDARGKATSIRSLIGWGEKIERSRAG